MWRMKRLVCALSIAGALLASGDANAQFQNRSLSAHIGYLDLDQVAGVVDWGIPLGLYYTSYIESGFEWTFGVHGMLLSVTAGDEVIGHVFGGGGGSGLRYLFLEETLRPYLGVELTYLGIAFGNLGVDLNPHWVGLGPNAGVDYFLTDTFSLGLKVQFNVYAALSTRLEFRTSKGGFLTFSAWF